MSKPDETWVPGDPLYPQARYRHNGGGGPGLDGRHGSGNPIYNFRYDSDSPEPGPDAARWPIPKITDDLDRFEDRAR